MIKIFIFAILLIILNYCSNKKFESIDPFENIQSHIKLNELFIELSNKTQIIERTLVNKAMLLRINERNLTVNSDNETDFCSQKTNELLKYFLNPENSTININDFKGFILYSSLGINDFGDYTNCVNTPEHNYLCLSINYVGISARMGLCYYKACNATYFNNSKDKIIDLLNARYSMNLTNATLSFSNPKESMEIYRENHKTGFIIMTVLFTLIALFSVLKLILTILGFGANNKSVTDSSEKVKSKSAINDTYQKLNDESNHQDGNDRKKLGALAFLDNFDVIKNTRAIFSVNNSNKTFEYLRVFDGIRVLSTAWVLWAHMFYIAAIFIGARNIYDFDKYSETFIYCILTSAYVSVDVFFYMSGFFLYFNLQKYLKHAKNKIMFFFVSLFQRYIRLLPFYFIAIFYIGYLLPFLIDSGKSDTIFPTLDGCKKYWWANVFYIQNYLNYDENSGFACAGHTWYLADDMLYFILTTLLLLIIQKKKNYSIFNNFGFICRIMRLVNS